MEETIIDSPIAIESEHLLKVLSGYSIADQGEPVIYSHLEEVLLHRGLDSLTVPQLLQACKDFKRATNYPPGAAFFHAAEKYMAGLIHSGKLRDDKIGQDGLIAEQKGLYRIAQSCFESNIGSNGFQLLLEQKLLQMWNQENLQEHVNLMKATIDYKIKDENLEK